MKKLFTLLLLVGLIALGYWAWTVLFPKPEQVICNHLNKLAKLASFSPNEGNFSRIAKIEKLGLLFDENVQVTVEISMGESQSLSFTRREELKQAAMAANRLTQGVKAEFVDMSIQMGPDKQSATADLMLNAKVSGENDVIAQELKFTFKQTNGDWLITRIETVKPVRR